MGLLVGGPANNLANLTVEETKFLGGDMEHTHLVKGLDYALLNKVRPDPVTNMSTSSNTLQLTPTNCTIGSF